MLTTATSHHQSTVSRMCNKLIVDNHSMFIVFEFSTSAVYVITKCRMNKLLKRTNSSKHGVDCNVAGLISMMTDCVNCVQ